MAPMGERLTLLMAHQLEIPTANTGETEAELPCPGAGGALFFFFLKVGEGGLVRIAQQMS